MISLNWMRTTYQPSLSRYLILLIGTFSFTTVCLTSFFLPSSIYSSRSQDISRITKHRITIVQHLAPRDDGLTPDELKELSRRSHEAYCEYHGYNYRLDRSEYFTTEQTSEEGELPGFNTHNNKLIVLHRAVADELAKGEEGSEWVAQMDADVLVIDPLIPLHLLLPPPSQSPSPIILANQDFNGFNNGVTLYRVTPLLLVFISQCIALEAELWATEQVHATDQALLARGIQRHPEIIERFYTIPQIWMNDYVIQGAEPSGEEWEPRVQYHLVAWTKWAEGVNWDEIYETAQKRYPPRRETERAWWESLWYWGDYTTREIEVVKAENVAKEMEEKTREYAERWWSTKAKAGIEGMVFTMI
ncbi:hypothetical protein TREMEDRAFT_62458 [Tremella mesenterica DSM 1558]|uniref:uncharacterized protein n=1 Tax=Tremella mesenterica (strain ATCC 24925 / CBS 8224 / DSM 1558 / NBRC 9311 / NRRL Y-6157 / RJB 2259-6 / UBC 559-6) TaxID=578456 RepID=UPI0003F4A483|nr:uncharacterized protein TREMEDRAFT_62458 [Tremella mesenterica DSM 1558]EIW69598.1 hypothetical protein TREMEDRAFT_62458 [Tremella mesenterica DSM 1558]